MRSRKAAISLAAASLFYIAAAYGTGMDRLAGTGAADPDMVPAPFRAEANVSAAVRLVQAKHYNASMAMADAALRSMPIDYRAIGLIGANRYFTGQALEANDAFTVADRLGFRDTFAQAYWLELAQRSGDAAGAAKRVDALLRANPTSPIVAVSLTGIEADPAIRIALAERMRKNPVWITSYAASSAEVTGPQFVNRLDVITRAAAHGARSQCVDMRDAVTSLLYRQNRPADARALWNVTCASGHEPAIGNGSFSASIPEFGTPFDWIMPGHGGVEADVADHALVVENHTSVPEIAASQTVLLPPGPVQFQWRAATATADANLAATLGLSCPDGLAVELHAERDAKTGFYHAAGLVPANCPQQILQVMALPDAGRTTIDDIALSPAQLPRQ